MNLIYKYSNSSVADVLFFQSLINNEGKEMFLFYLFSILQILWFPDLWCFLFDIGMIGVYVITARARFNNFPARG